MMVGGKQTGGTSLGGRNQDGYRVMKFFFKLRISHPRSGNYCVCYGWCTHTPCRTTVSLRGVQTSRTRVAQRFCSAHVTSLHLTLSILMFHPPSLLFPQCHFETTFPSAPSSSNCPRPESAGQVHFRTSGGEFRYLADPTHSTAPRRLAGFIACLVRFRKDVQDMAPFNCWLPVLLMWGFRWDPPVLSWAPSGLLALSNLAGSIWFHSVL